MERRIFCNSRGHEKTKSRGTINIIMITIINVAIATSIQLMRKLFRPQEHVVHMRAERGI